MTFKRFLIWKPMERMQCDQKFQNFLSKLRKKNTNSNDIKNWGNEISHLKVDVLFCDAFSLFFLKIFLSEKLLTLPTKRHQSIQEYTNGAKRQQKEDGKKKKL